ncbi:MAG: polysaccharide biosynthesis tyrosine autokinase [Alphaproteobacteria bacterium]|nr:polysaccharide biosynthesis tyrosine autokinase [Alphaproteobacteria bacterium]
MENLPDIKDIAYALWRRKWLLLSIMFVPIIIGFFVISSLPAKYTAAAALLIEKQELKLANFEDALAGPKFSEETIQTEIGVIKSQALALKTIEEANLMDEPEFTDIKKSAGDSAVSKQKYVDRFMRNLDVSALGGSHVVNLAYRSENPELAAKIANMHTRNYIEYNKQTMAARSQALYKWLSKQVVELKQETTEKAQKVQQYRAKHGLVMGKGAEELIYQQISDTSALLTPLETRRLELEARQETIDRLRKEGRSGSLSQVISSPLIQDLKSQQALAEQQMQTLRSDYGARHPKMLAAQNEVRGYQAKINNEIAMIVDSTSSELSTVRKQENLLNSRMQQLQKKADASRGDQVVLNTLENELVASRNALNNALVRLEDVKAQASLSRSNAEVVAWANPPIDPSEPNKILLFAVVIVLSTGLALMAVFLVEIFQKGFNSLQEVKASTGRTPLGIIPYVRNIKPYEMVSSYSIFSDAIKKIYMYGLMKKLKEENGQAVLIASAQPNEGKSTVAMSLAYYMATIGKKVLVVDTDINRPSIHAMAKTQLRRGFSDLMTDNISLSDVTYRDGTGKLDIITAGSTKMLSPDLWHSERNMALIKEMKSKYDVILFDSPPLLALADAAAMAALMDEVIVVAHWAKTSKKKVAHIIEQIEALSKPILGVVLSKVKIHQYATYDYGDAGVYYGANARYYGAK